MIKLTEIYKRIFEANFPWGKFKDPKGKHRARPTPPSAGLTSKDLGVGNADATTDGKQIQNVDFYRTVGNQLHTAFGEKIEEEGIDLGKLTDVTLWDHGGKKFRTEVIDPDSGEVFVFLAHPDIDGGKTWERHIHLGREPEILKDFGYDPFGGRLK